MTLKVELPHSFMLSTGNVVYILLKTVFTFSEKKSLFYETTKRMREKPRNRERKEKWREMMIEVTQTKLNLYTVKGATRERFSLFLAW
jgi:hypothetical protein